MWILFTETKKDILFFYKNIYFYLPHKCEKPQVAVSKKKKKVVLYFTSTSSNSSLCLAQADNCF